MAGRAEVVAVDMSEPALALASSNAERNGVQDRLRTIKQDCFKAVEELAAAGELFDAVILDPPKLARNRQGLDARITRAYYESGIVRACTC